MRIVSLAIALFVFWLLLSGHFDPFLVVSGAAASILIAALGRPLGYANEEGHPIEFVGRGLLYWPWLLKEIVKSALAVARIILDPALPISPRLVRVRASQKTAVGTVTYANSITLTPGTITVEVDRHAREFVVHALTGGAVAGLAEGEMDRRVSAFEGRG
jgi:multicomponent Na+:H+ antiporter subunit E